MLVGAAWGILTYVLHFQIIGQVPLPIAVYVAPTIFFSGTIARTIIVNTFRSRTIVAGNLIYTYVPNPYTEILGAVISMFIGLTVVYAIWRISK